jgi:uncharacterized protein YaaQ
MKMVMAVVQRDEAENVLQALIAAGHTATLIESRGGMLRQAWMTMFVAVKKDDVDQVLGIIKTNCVSDINVEASEQAEHLSQRLASAQAKVGGAVTFVWDLDKFEVY